jgi:hypothetical protein
MADMELLNVGHLRTANQTREQNYDLRTLRRDYAPASLPRDERHALHAGLLRLRIGCSMLGTIQGRRAIVGYGG